MAPLTRPSFNSTSSATSSSTNRPIVNIRRKCLLVQFDSGTPMLHDSMNVSVRPNAALKAVCGQLWRNSLLDHRRRAYTGGWTGDSTTPQAPAPTPMALLAVLTRPPSGLTGQRFAFDDHRRRRRAAAI